MDFRLTCSAGQEIALTEFKASSPTQGGGIGQQHLEWVEVEGSHRPSVLVNTQDKCVFCTFHQLCCVIPSRVEVNMSTLSLQ